MKAQVITELAHEDATCALGARLGAAVQTGDVVALEGTLGAGKTTLVRACVRARCGRDMDVPSPGFTLVHIYEAADIVLWHADLYRVEAAAEIVELGLDEARDLGALLVEWPGKMGAHLPRERLHLTLEIVSPRARRVHIAAFGARAEALAALLAGECA